MEKKIRITLTYEEAQNLLFALCNSTDYPDVMVSLFEESEDIANCLKAEAKIKIGIAKSQGCPTIRELIRTETAAKIKETINYEL